MDSFLALAVVSSRLPLSKDHYAAAATIVALCPCPTFFKVAMMNHLRDECLTLKTHSGTFLCREVDRRGEEARKSPEGKERKKKTVDSISMKLKLLQA